MLHCAAALQVKCIRKMKAEVNRSSEDYEAHLGRFLQLKRSSDEAQVLLQPETVTEQLQLLRSTV
jgi:hypothetical protein